VPLSPPQNAALTRLQQSLPGVTVRTGQLEQWPAVVKLATGDLPLSRQHLVAAALDEVTRHQGPAAVHCALASHRGEPLAAALAVHRGGDHAQLLGFGCRTSAPTDPALLNGAVVAHLHHNLEAAGCRFVQSSCAAEEASPPCAAVGYAWLASLDYMRAASAACAAADSEGSAVRPAVFREPPACFTAEGWNCQPIDPTTDTATRRRLIAVVQASYQGTLDCPRLNAFRSAAEVLDGYIAAPAFQPTGWRIVSEGPCDVACLMTSYHAAGEALELTYMGIAPAARGRGLGNLLVAETGRIARLRQARQVVLAVDRSNHPACRLYRRCGFEPIGSEAVWGRKLRRPTGEPLSCRTGNRAQPASQRNP
jgi:ribosomal protein S18 acetylase RimI-like enzyme